MWMPLLKGDHVSTDVAVVDGEPRWWRHVIGKSIGDGMFDYWTVLADDRPEIEGGCGDWLRAHLGGYTGMVNLETIDAQIIEVHLRFSDQWPDLYGVGWTEALVRLYGEGVWDYADDDRRDGYSVVLFGPHGLQYWHPDQELIDELMKHPEITSIQITFHEDKPMKAHSMPPGGFRLAIVNCWTLAAGMAARSAWRYASGRPRKSCRGGPGAKRRRRARRGSARTPAAEPIADDGQISRLVRVRSKGMSREAGATLAGSRAISISSNS